MDFKDYYSTLGIGKSATDKEIKQAFRKLARKFHPDVNPGDKAAEARFKEINEANEVLSDPAKRKKYDELGANWRMYEQARQQGRPGPGHPFGGAWGAPGGAGGFQGMSEEDVAQMFGGDDGPFSDFFRTFFGGAGEGASAGGERRTRSRAPRSAKGRDVEHELELDLEDALQGTVQRLAIRHGGEARTVEVRIPAGVTDGSRVRVSGEGERGGGSGASGDLYLRVRLRAHGTFERKGRDLYVKVRVPITTAVLGGEVDVPTLPGRSLRLKVPQTTQNGQLFRLRGHGLPKAGAAAGEDTGDLYATVDIGVPQTLSDEQKKHYEALAELDKK
ncbi:MAG TPA: J domain-containing protein [Vicinamibacterales bacterium]|nr:J domain-containing protein [Vicinamibacterales bacterium]